MKMKQTHPTRSFEQLVADATLAKFGGYINQEIQSQVQVLKQQHAQNTSDLLTRIVALEEVLLENLPAVTKEVLANQIASVQDRNEGLVTITEGTVQLNDRVRIEVKTKTADQTEFQGSSRLLLDKVGSGQTLGKELESSILGMTTGETKEVKFGEDAALIASISLNRISRAPKTETTGPEGKVIKSSTTNVEVELKENETPEQAEERVVNEFTEELVHASANAG